MSAECGLPNFNTTDADLFWSMYPALKKKGLLLKGCSHPDMFEKDPSTAWGFYGSRYEDYSAATPHAGYTSLLEIANSRPGGYFVLTTNVDGLFVKAGYDEDRLAEAHGSVHWLCCTAACSAAAEGTETWAAGGGPGGRMGAGRMGVDPSPSPLARMRVDRTTLLATAPPACPRCAAPARPIRIGLRHRAEYIRPEDPDAEERRQRYDALWRNARSVGQEARLAAFRERVLSARARVVVLEVGVGGAVATLHDAVSAWADGSPPCAAVVRVNLEPPPSVRPGPSAPVIEVRCGAMEALCAIAAIVASLRSAPPAPILGPPLSPPVLGPAPVGNPSPAEGRGCSRVGPDADGGCPPAVAFNAA